MRRKDREMDRDFAYYVIDKSNFASLAVYDGSRIENIPLSIVREGDKLYFHSAQAGNKVEIFKSRPQVTISFVTDLKIPNNYSPEELEAFKEDRSRARELISNVFTTEFASALVYGRLELVESRQEQIQAMRLICEKYTGDKMDLFDLAIEAGLSRVNVYRVLISEISSKRKKYNREGIELKYMKKE